MEQAPSAENDAVSASIPEPEAADRPADVADAETELAPAPEADAVVAEVNPPAEESTAEPAARRRGRPRKARPEAQPEATTEANDQEQATAAAISTDGDDPFGLDPLL